MPPAKDKKRVTIVDLLNSYKDGLSIQDMVNKTGLARHTVLARLHRLEGEGRVRVRKVNMAKLYYWNKVDDKDSSKLPHQENIVLNPLKEKHIKEKARPQVTYPKTSSKLKSPNVLDVADFKKQIKLNLDQGFLKGYEKEIQLQRAPITHVLDQKKHKTGRKPDEFLLTGISGFDALFEKGIPKHNSVIVAGGAGSGKTIFCLQMIYKHALDGDNCLYMSFEESEDRLIHHMEDFGWYPHEIIKKGNLLIRRFNPFDITRSVDALLMEAKGELLIDIEPIIFPKGFKPNIIIIDSLSAIASAFVGKEDSYRIYIEQLFRFFEKINATSFLISETEQIPKIFSASGVEEFLADGVIVFYNIKRGNLRESAIEVLKMRGEKHEKKIVAMKISDNGIVVYPEQEVFGGFNEGLE